LLAVLPGWHPSPLRRWQSVSEEARDLEAVAVRLKEHRKLAEVLGRLREAGPLRLLRPSHHREAAVVPVERLRHRMANRVLELALRERLKDRTLLLSRQSIRDQR
jgi:hypothetical protein